MRLFIAIDPGEAVREALAGTMAALRADGVRGNFTRRENLHLTLHFLGELPPPHVARLTSLLQSCADRPFSLTLGALGTFPGVLWVSSVPDAAAERDAGLTALVSRLGAALDAAGYAVDRRPYRAHLTLARELTLPDGVDLRAAKYRPRPVTFTVADVRLMRSSRAADGRLVYTPLAVVPLERGAAR